MLAGLLLPASWLCAPRAMAQVQHDPCTAPKIGVNKACGGVVTLVASGGAASGATYSWTLGNGSTATGFGPVNVVYAGAGPFTVTLTVNNPACDSPVVSTASVTPDLGGGCCPAGIAADHLLGGVGVTTTLTGNHAYSGIYRVLGNLVLTNGDYQITGSNTVFYVDGYATCTPLPTPDRFQRAVTGSTITVSNRALLMLESATLTAAGGKTDCPMWGGLVVGGQGQDPNVPYRLRMDGATISHALCGLRLLPDTEGTGMAYRLAHAQFHDNLTHVYDISYHQPGQVSLIDDCTFSSNVDQMHFPYDHTSPYNQFITYQALFLAPSPKGLDALMLRHNTFNNQVYGIVNNLTSYYYGGVQITGSLMSGVYGTGIWTMNNFGAATGVPTVSVNVIKLAASPSVSTAQIDPLTTLYGLVGEVQGYRNAYLDNNVSIENYAGPGSYRPTVGLSVTGPTDVRANKLQQGLTQGVAASGLDDSHIFDNLFSDCDNALVVQPNQLNASTGHRLGCNTFYRNQNSYTRGIVVEQGATINDIGSNSSPAGNKFDGMDEGIRNDNTNTIGFTFRYYRTLSAQELPSVNGPGNTQIILPANPPSSVNYCTQQGANNGVNSRGTPPSPEYLAAIQDSVRRQLAPPTRCRAYLHELLTYYRDAQQLPALESWWQTLAVPNASAYRTVGCFLLLHFDQAPATDADARRVLTGLQSQALLDAELAAHLQLRAVLRHLPHTVPSLTAADSTSLRTLAWSGTSSALSAGRWLRYFHPHLLLPSTPALRPAAPPPARPASGAVLGAAYPNPAQTQVRINCRLAQAGQAAELRFTNLLTGQLALTVPLEGTGPERSQTVPLAGQYAYQLLVNGQLAAAPQKLVVNP